MKKRKTFCISHAKIEFRSGCVESQRCAKPGPRQWSDFASNKNSFPSFCFTTCKICCRRMQNLWRKEKHFVFHMQKLNLDQVVSKVGGAPNQSQNNGAILHQTKSQNLKATYVKQFFLQLEDWWAAYKFFRKLLWTTWRGHLMGDWFNCRIFRKWVGMQHFPACSVNWQLTSLF